MYCGDVVVLGETGDGGEGDVPEHLIDLAQQLFGLHESSELHDSSELPDPVS
ncbi:hypothetical protein ACFRAU_11625 [Arthrobacter sp. NPDC056691]|uniref:hypothetical protein n=1 Tax=Arthrobacter sp. NPDC056691 TaxID=3345913 RepID=UPI003670264F